jgi:HK97 family phage major capsid protein
MRDGNPMAGSKDYLGTKILADLDKKPEIKQAYFDLHPEIKALSVGDDAQGGFFVNADLSGRVIKKIYETSPMRQYASVTAISTDALEGQIDADQVDYGWIGETGTRSVTANPQIGMWRIPTYEMYAQPKTTQKLLDDAAWDPEAWLSGKIADKFSRVENAAFVNGIGVNQPWGFLSKTLVADATGAASDDFITKQRIGFISTGASAAFPTASTTVVQANPLVDMIYALKSVYRDRPGTAFAMHRSTMGVVRKLQDLYGNYIWQPAVAVGQPSTLLGYPVAEFNDMPLIAANSFSIAFANWAESYQIVDRVGIRVLRDPYTAKPYVLFYSTKRVGGDVLNFEAIKLLKFI